MFMLLTRLFRPAASPALAPPPPPLRRHPPCHPPCHPRPDAAAGDDPQQGCGWFDSSHELMQGVTVWEGIVVVDNTVANH